MEMSRKDSELLKSTFGSITTEYEEEKTERMLKFEKYDGVFWININYKEEILEEDQNTINEIKEYFQNLHKRECEKKYKDDALIKQYSNLSHYQGNIETLRQFTRVLKTLPDSKTECLKTMPIYSSKGNENNYLNVNSNSNSSLPPSSYSLLSSNNTSLNIQKSPRDTSSSSSFSSLSSNNSSSNTEKYALDLPSSNNRRLGNSALGLSLNTNNSTNNNFSPSNINQSKLSSTEISIPPEKKPVPKPEPVQPKPKIDDDDDLFSDF